jgi:uncharacterized protein with HEPN domain
MFFGTNIAGSLTRIIWNVVVDELPRLKAAIKSIASAAKE